MNYNKEYSKSEIIKIICESAHKYRENLLNKNIIFIFENRKTKKIDFVETLCTKYNFLHLTGIDYYQNSIKFFKDCLNQELSSDNIKIKNKVFTQAKLQVLENAMSINKSAKRIGSFNQKK